MKSLTPEQLLAAIEVLDVLHTKAVSRCHVRTAQSLTASMAAARKELAEIEEQATHSEPI